MSNSRGMHACCHDDHAGDPEWVWVTNPGAGLYSLWRDDQGGLDFELGQNKTKAQRACSSERDVRAKRYYCAYNGSRCFGTKLPCRSALQGIPDPNALWYSLGMMQRRRLAETSASTRLAETSASSTCAIEEDCVPYGDRTSTEREPLQSRADPHSCRTRHIQSTECRHGIAWVSITSRNRDSTR